MFVFDPPADGRTGEWEMQSELTAVAAAMRDLSGRRTDGKGSAFGVLGTSDLSEMLLLKTRRGAQASGIG